MSRLFLLIAIAIVIYLLIKSYRKNASQQDQDKTVTEDMVRCTHCGVHLPKGESILTGGNFFCCAEHRDAHGK
jgi:uncharacterized protein